MKQFFSQRLQRHQKQMTRYLRYVFNDHFALISTFWWEVWGCIIQNC